MAASMPRDAPVALSVVLLNDFLSVRVARPVSIR
jgi:hypothetical protein